jgi:AcrR family transcriptional regulator
MPRMTTSSTGRYAGSSAAERKAERRGRLLETALELLGTEGWAGTTVRSVCAHAKLNPRYFYESFTDLDALVLALFDEVALDTSRALLAAAAQAPAGDAEAAARAAIGTFITHVTDDPRIARVLFAEALGNEALARRRLDAMHEMWGILATFGRGYYGEAAGADPIADVAAALLVGGMTELLLAWLDGRLALTREQLIDDVAALFVVTAEGAVAIARARTARGRKPRARS